ncbi:ATPase [Filifactor villosus]|uniref:ATPase n=1 Tax=Filifactor villosus TaxID=29374 RepID=A0ABV9QHI2_9FIRM|nr:ATPase [Filifactor alocis]
MEVLKILDELQSMLEEGTKTLFGNKVSIDRELALSYISDMRLGLPEDFKQAEWINKERQKFIDDAQEEAEQIRAQAREEAEEMIMEHVIVKKAEQRAKEIIERAIADGNELRNGSISYAQDILEKLGMDMERVNARISANYEELEKLKIKSEALEKEEE